VLALRERGLQPCRCVASLIDLRLGEVNQRLRDPRAFRAELTGLRDRMCAEGVVKDSDGYCHYIQSHAHTG
jgi:hypothetical protein